MGGGYSLKAALNIPQLNACVINYGALITEKETIDKINCPILGIFGEQDKGIPPETVNKFKNAAKAEGKDVEIHIYPAVGHAFMNPANKSGYNKATADEAWNEIYSFLNNNLKK